jgi:hypothetical protein
MRAPVPFQRGAASGIRSARSAGPTSRGKQVEVRNGMSGGGTQSWIMSRICAALDQADVARATVHDLDDHVLVGATIQLAEDLEAFALSLAGRLSELGDLPGAGDRVSQRDRSSA